jgi:Predicted integral membrane protein
MSLFGRETAIAADNDWALLTIMCVSVALAIWLEQKYKWASKISGAIIALICALVLSNLGVIPTSCNLYDNIIWGFAVPMGIPLLLLQCNMKKIWKETGRMTAIFLIGSVGTIVGAFVAYFALHNHINELAGIAAMMTGSYIGGGVNFAAMADEFKVSGGMVSATTVADNMLMAIYFFVLILFAGLKFFRKNYTHPSIDEVEAATSKEDSQTLAAAFWSRKDISLKDIAMNFAYCVVIVTFSKLIAGLLTAAIPTSNAVLNMCNIFFGSQYVWITTLSMLVATYGEKQVAQLHGSQELGTYLIYLFLFVIGVPASIMQILTKTPLLFVFTGIMVVVNMLFCFVFGKIFHFDLEDIILASNANIGGPTTAAGMAISQGWSKLVGPAMLVGTLGYVIGNYCGVLVGGILGA